MFRFFKKIANTHTESVASAALIIGSMSFLSQILAVVRDRFLAHYIGPGEMLDVYYASFRIPDIMLISIGSLFAATALIPFLVETIRKDREGVSVNTHLYTQEFIDTILTGYTILMGGISVVIFFLFPYIIPVLFSGFSDSALVQTIFLSRVLLVQVFFLGFSYIFQSLNQAFKRIFLFSLSPIVYNLGIVLGTVFLYPIWGIAGVTYGVVVGAFLHVLVQFFGVYGYLFTPKILRRASYLRIKSVVIHSLPRTLSLAIVNLSITGLLALASRLPDGSISLLTFAYGIQSVPVVMVGTSFALASFPLLVDQFKYARESLFPKTLEKMTRDIVFWSVPCVVFFVFARIEIVRILLGGKAFSWVATHTTATLLAIFMASTVFQALTTLFSRVYFAAEKTKYALCINTISSALSLSLVYSALYFFPVPYELRIYVLAIGFSFGQILTTVLFVCISIWQIPELIRVIKNSSTHFLKIIFINCIFLGALYFVSKIVLYLLPLTTLFSVLVYVGCIGIFGGSVWLYVAQRMHMSEIVPIVNKFKKLKKIGNVTR